MKMIQSDQSDHVVFIPLIFLCAVVCDCCFTVELEKKPVKLEVQEIIRGTPRRPPCMPNSEITIKNFLYTNYCSFTYTC